MNKVLIVIDAQEDFTRGALHNSDAVKALPIIKDIVEYAENNNFDIFYTMDTHFMTVGLNYLETQEGKNLPVPHCIYESPGWYRCPEVIGIKNHEIIIKHTFGYSEWESRLSGKPDEIWLCGFCTDICVSANFQILKAIRPETPIVVIQDACAGVTPKLHKAALDVMKSCQAKIIEWSDLKNEH